MKADKINFIDIVVFAGGLFWVFTTNSSETFWTISISLSLGFIAKSYLIYKAKKVNEESSANDSSDTLESNNFSLSDGEISSQQDYSENEELVSKSEYTIVHLSDKDGNEYRYSFDDSLLPENFNEVDDDYLIKAKEYHHSLNRPNIPDDIFNEDDSVDEENQFAYSYDGMLLSKKELENEEAEMIPINFIINQN